MRLVHCFSALSNYLSSIHHLLELNAGVYQRNDICRLGCELVRQLFVVGNEVRNVDIAVVLLDQNILADLVSIRSITSVLLDAR